jgi:hypothetical protein
VATPSAVALFIRMGYCMGGAACFIANMHCLIESLARRKIAHQFRASLPDRISHVQPG